VQSFGKRAYTALKKENPNYKLSMEGEGSLLGVRSLHSRRKLSRVVLTLFILIILASGGSIVLSSKGDILFVHQEKVFGDVAKVNLLILIDAYDSSDKRSNYIVFVPLLSLFVLSRYE
jgi:hypothetical protein